MVWEKRKHMASTPAISVVIPAYNAAGTLMRAVASVLAQTRKADEIIVVDDASTDDTVAVAAAIAAVKLVRLPLRHGAAAARNAGIAAAAGSWIAFLDADDVWLPEKLEWQAPAMTDGASMVFCASEEFAADGASLGDTFRGRPVVAGSGAWRELLRRNFVATPTVMAPRELLMENGGFDESLSVGEDQDMWIRLALRGALAYVPQTLVQVYVQRGSLSLYRRSDQSRFVLPMICRHVERLGARLTRAEVRVILGERYANAGHIAFAHGDLLRSAAFFVKAMRAGYRPSAWRAPVLMQRQLG